MEREITKNFRTAKNYMHKITRTKIIRPQKECKIRNKCIQSSHKSLLIIKTQRQITPNSVLFKKNISSRTRL